MGNWQLSVIKARRPRYRKLLGELGEAIAGTYLLGKQWRIENKNWRGGRSTKNSRRIGGEIDLVAIKQGIEEGIEDRLAFIEVKTRVLAGPSLEAFNQSFVSAVETIGPRERMLKKRAIVTYMQERDNLLFSLDLVFVGLLDGNIAFCSSSQCSRCGERSKTSARASKSRTGSVSTCRALIAVDDFHFTDTSPSSPVKVSSEPNAQGRIEHGYLLYISGAFA